MAPTLDALSVTAIVAALLASLSGSLHCLAMCGPLRILSGDSKRARAVYQLGRGAAYIVMGTLAGYTGASLPPLALVLVVIAGFALSFGKIRLPGGGRTRILLHKMAGASPFLLGLSSGLLPCGLLHAWIAAAAATASPVRGAIMLGVLWAGSLPALELGGMAFAVPLKKLRLRFPRALPLAFLLLALIPLATRMSLSVSEKGQTETCPLHGSK